MARSKQVASFEEINSPFVSPEFITLVRIEVKASGQMYEKFTPFPSGLEGIDYENLIANRLITSLENFGKIDFARCQGCGN
jgi:hypothetical protein